MSQMEIGKKVNEVEGHERKAEDDADPFLTSFAYKRRSALEVTDTIIGALLVHPMLPRYAT